MLDGSLFRDLSGMFYVSGYLNRNSSLPKPLITISDECLP